jgi:beta-lactamase superfamily II metal-dependent hydrolase
MRILGAALCVAGLTIVASAAKTLDIYFIDVEGGQSTLIVTPAGESLLVDTGYWGNNGRDAGRIMAAARDAGIKRIDYLLITHFHGDHDGGVMDLAPQIPIRTFIDHGSLTADAPKDSPFPELSPSVYNAYLGVRAKGKHVEPKVGDRIPLKGVIAVVVSSAAATIARPLAGAGQPNPACPPVAPEASEATENPRSTGIHLRFGRFRFIDVGDLTGAPLFALFCPNNMLGYADVYLLPHHGNDDVSHPAYVAAVRPRAAIVNNGATKGGEPKTFAMLHDAARATGLDVWQLHRSRKDGSENFADARIANLDETTGHWIKLSASRDGSFSVTNQRTGGSQRYPRPAR